MDGGTRQMSIQPRDVDPSHMYISFVKSGVRVVCGLMMMAAGWGVHPMLMYAGLALIIAEVLGVLEEIV